MKNGRDPDVVDLARARKAREAQARDAQARDAQARALRRLPAGAPGGREPLLGANRRAGPILAVVLLILFVLFLGPGLLRLLG